MIKMQVIGHLGKDVVQNSVQGKTVLNFSIAHSESFKDAQGVKRDKTIWVDCNFWTERVGIAPYLKQGTQIYAEGQPELRQYTTRDGKQGTSLSLRVSNVQLLGGKKEEGGGNGTQNSNGGYFQQQGNATGNYVDPNDITEPISDLPF